jgi:protein-S-isoprenylcysteine O-methyltransferase Ste14
MNTSNVNNAQQKSLDLVTVQQNARSTGTYGAALIGTASPVPVIAALISVVIFIGLPQFPVLPQSPWSELIASLGGTVLTLILWLLVAIPYRRFTAVDLANPSSYELLLNRVYQIDSWLTILEPEKKA